MPKGSVKGVGDTEKGLTDPGCSVGRRVTLCLTAMLIISLTVSVAPAEEFNRASFVTGLYWTVSDARWSDELEDPTGAETSTLMTNFADSYGEVYAKAHSPYYGVHKVKVRATATQDVACSWAQGWTNTYDTWRFNRYNSQYPSEGTVGICYSMDGFVTIDPDFSINIQFIATLDGEEIVEIYEDYTSGWYVRKTVCGQAHYTIDEPLDYYESFFVQAFPWAGCSRYAEVKGSSEGEFSNTFRMVSITPSEGHYLEWAASGAAYPPMLPPSIGANEGTIGTELTIEGSGFGDKKGKVLIGGAALKIAKDGWSDSSIRGTVKKVLPAGPYTVTITPKGESSFSLTDTFTMTNPMTSTVTPENGVAGAEVMVEGSFFGIKKGKVYLEDGSGTQSKCKVTEWYMDPPTGVSRLRFLVPTKLTSGKYTLGITNKVGAITTPFTIGSTPP